MALCRRPLDKQIAATALVYDLILVPAIIFRYRSAEHWIEIFRSYYGPTHKAFAALPPPRQSELHVALIELLSKHNRARGEGSLVIPGEYLEVVIVKS